MRQGAHHEPRKAGCLRHARKPDSSRGRHAALRITVLGTQEAVQAALSPLLEQGAQAVEFVPCEEENAVTARIVCSGRRGSARTGGIALAARACVLRMDAETTSLEDVFLS